MRALTGTVWAINVRRRRLREGLAFWLDFLLEIAPGDLTPEEAETLFRAVNNSQLFWLGTGPLLPFEVVRYHVKQNGVVQIIGRAESPVPVPLDAISIARGFLFTGDPATVREAQLALPEGA